MTHTLKRLSVKAVVALGLGLGAWTSVEAQSLTWLGTLGGNWSEARGVSADGSVVVGWAQNALGLWRAFVWTSIGGMEDLGTLGGTLSIALSVSHDGSVVVGWSRNINDQDRAFRWTRQSRMQEIIPSPYRSTAWGVSADGSLVVGSMGKADGSFPAFVWNNGVIQEIGTLGGLEAIAYDVTVVGNEVIVVGRSQVAGRDWGNSFAFLWKGHGAIRSLGTLGGTVSEARGISADGSVVVGGAHDSNRQWRAFRWTERDGMQDLGIYGYANDVSADGSVIVGFWGESGAFRWTTNQGIENLNVSYFYLLRDGSFLINAQAISPDGRYIVGYGYNAATRRQEAYLLDTRCTVHNGDVDNNRCVDDADLLAVLFAFGNSGQNLGRVDVNCDGTVDDADLLIVLFNFGQGC